MLKSGNELLLEMEIAVSRQFMLESFKESQGRELRINEFKGAVCWRMRMRMKMRMRMRIRIVMMKRKTLVIVIRRRRVGIRLGFSSRMRIGIGEGMGRRERRLIGLDRI